MRKSYTAASTYICERDPLQAARYFYRRNILSEIVTMHSIKKNRKCIEYYGQEPDINIIREVHSWRLAFKKVLVFPAEKLYSMKPFRCINLKNVRVCRILWELVGNQ